MEPRLDYAATAMRPTWAELPVAVRQLVAGRLGSPVVAARSQGAGFTPGFASRLTCADGRRAFVKAASSAQPDIAKCYRDEARIVAALPLRLPVPRLHWVADDGDWVILCFEDVPGRTPRRPWLATDLRRVLDTVARLADALSPAPPAVVVPGIEEALATDFTGWRSLAGAEATTSEPYAERAPLDGWVTAHLDALATLEAGWAAACGGNSLVHCDLRSDNVILSEDGHVYICDWNWPCTAAPWVDIVCLLPSAYADGYNADELLAHPPVGRAADRWAVDAFLAGLAGFFAVASRQPDVPSSPALRRHQAEYGAATLGWLRARRGWS